MAAGREEAPWTSYDRCVRADSGGTYRVDTLPPGLYAVDAMCPAAGEHPGARVTARAPLGAGGDARLDLRLGAARCDRRPLRVLRGEFRGRYTSGFEVSHFVPCPGTASGVGSADVTFAPEAAAGVRWPRTGERDYTTYFVRWRGVLQGPGSYGHLGGEPYWIEVGRVLEVRRPGPADCEGERPPPAG